MSTLVILLPPRERLGAQSRSGSSDAAAGEYAYVLSADGLTIAKQGACAPSLMPKADSVVAVLADTDLSWHRISLPKAPAQRLRAALAGLLEEQLLDEGEAMHLAAAPDALAGQPTWVAATRKPWLAAHLEALEKAGVFVERVVPLSWPSETPAGHFFVGSSRSDGSISQVGLVYGDSQGVQFMRLAGGLPRTMLARWSAAPLRWSAAPAVAAQAERWLGAPVIVQSDAERALLAMRSLWNLRQFDLAPHHRGVRALRELFKRWRHPAWRPVRAGLAALVALHLLGLNLWAWQLRQSAADKRFAMVELLRSAHPQVRAVLDAPLQMRRETDLLRAAAGRPGDDDLELLLAAAASAWPEGRAPVDALRFEPGRLTLTVIGWTAPQVEALRARLRPAGWAVEATEGRLTISRAAAGAQS
jgi:general secretion pathway protein L